MSQTLLLGLGGTGSRIVNNVALDLKKRKVSINDGNICCAVLDTNENDNGKIEKTKVGVPVVPTSKKRIIAEYMEMYSDKGVNNWMPVSPAILKESMGDGASQMRTKSRLALMDTIEDKTILELENFINKLFDKRDNAKIRVMIVSSLAGGTGSGMFIQTALWIRKFFAKRKIDITIRGIFLLPDVFINTIKDIRDDETEIESLYANAYGAVRELNAITKIKTKNYKPQLPVKIDNLFNSDTDINDGLPVYDYAFFMDDISEGGSVLSQIDEYEQVAARLVYMQLYAPMHNDLYSEEDNLFKRFQKSTEPVFGSCGTAKAVYPVQDVLNYCSLKAVQESISNGWRRIDIEIDDKQKKEAEAEKSGKTLSRRISPRHEFVRLFDVKSTKSGAQVGTDKLFLNIANDVKIEHRTPGDDGFAVVEYEDKVLEFISNIDEQVALTVDDRNPGSLKELKLAKTWIEKTTETKETLKKLVEKKQKDVKRFLDDTDLIADELADEIIDSVFPADMGDINASNDASVFGLFVSKDSNEDIKYVHPVAVRYLLYRLSSELDAIKSSSFVDSARTCAEKGYGNGKTQVIFDNPKTKAVETDALEYLNGKVGWQKKETFIKTFMSKYFQHNGSQFELCRAYAISIVRYKLAILMSKRLEKLIKPVEEFFSNLVKVTNTLDAAIEANVRKNEKIVQKIVYVCASGEEKESLYESLKINTAVSDDSINSMIVRSLYGKFCAEEKPDADNNSEYVDVSVENAFYREALSNYTKVIRKNYKDAVDMDIYSAVCAASDIAYEKERKSLEENDDLISDILNVDLESGEENESDSRHDRHIKAMKNLVSRLHDLGAPFLISDDEFPVTEGDEDDDDAIKHMKIKKRKTFWGFNPVVAEKCPELGTILDVNIGLQQNNAYVKNELDCYRAIYGIQAGYVEKFNELKGGDYYKNYKNVVNQMIEGVAHGNDTELVHTPHLDKTWHLFLPYITPEKQQQETEKFYRLFWLAVAYGMITVDNSGKFRIVRYKKDDAGYEYSETETISLNGTTVGKVDVLELISALKLDGAFIADAQRFEKKFKEECDSIETYEGTIFLRGESVKTTGNADAAKTTSGGLATKLDTNAVTLIIRYNNSKKHDTNVTASLIRTLENLCFEFVKNKYEESEAAKVDLKKYEICQRIYKASEMRNKDIELLNHWKNAWSKF